jgi:AcrR family transcriptional regulator
MDDHPSTGIPRSLALWWGIEAAATTRGPKPGLTIGRIVDAAVAVADAEGLGAVSMARVAADLGYTTMSLYRYVERKDELVALMVDAAAGPPVPADRLGGGWRTDLEAWSWHLLTSYRRHPWVVDVPISGPPLGRHSLVLLDQALAALAPTRLGEDEKLGVVLLLSTYVRNQAALGRDLAAGWSDGAVPSYRRQVAELIDDQRFPAIHRAMIGGAFDPDPDDQGYGDADVGFGLHRILDGVEVLVRNRSGAEAGGEAPQSVIDP